MLRVSRDNSSAVSTDEEKKTVVLIHKYDVDRTGLRLFVEQFQRYKVVFAGACCLEAALSLQKSGADILLLDADFRDPSDLQAVSVLRTASPSTPILVLTESHDLLLHRKVMEQGASGVFAKNQGCETLLKAMTKVIEGEIWLDRSLIKAVLEDARLGGKSKDESGKIQSLTNREREVISLVCKGLRNQEVADRLFISEKTVRNHMVSIFSKLHVSNRLALSAYAQSHGVIA